MTHHEVRPGTGGGSSTLVVKGKDLTALMDIAELAGIPYPAMSPAIRVLTILARYAAFGVVPMVIPSVAVDLPVCYCRPRAPMTGMFMTRPLLKRYWAR